MARFSSVFRSITSDNGSEFASLSQTLPETSIYYAHPYSAYERGLNEKQSSLLRRFFPKGRSLDGISPDTVQKWINCFLRKAFGSHRLIKFPKLSYLMLQFGGQKPQNVKTKIDNELCILYNYGV